jgi:hypothetical protein
MRTIALVLVCIVTAIVMAGCGGGGGTDKGLQFGYRLGVAVYMKPAPPTRSFPPWSETATAIRINEVVQFDSIVHPDSSSSIYEGTNQVAYGQIAGSMTGRKVIVYSYTNGYYVQPLDSTSIGVRNDNSWIAPAHSGVIYALIVKDDYLQPNYLTTLPVVDGTIVFAVAVEP